ncbi:thiamine kinase-like enzyme [Inquilinus ginsengisoli]|uniref:Thiamine kinase-like enzyme n=1 Tax=Inquilinus ginsengisoli TaxID=363840 RepID=A0ABU1JIU5_9PROT|nr:choline kinase family protein [Inquilinus ginsengisoli]MDR6288521.1 thiamine kinase-like enzyme [Inquilinus ginsengisoli]
MPEASDIIAGLGCWSGRIAIAPLAGGLTNRNYRVDDAAGRHVVRLGDDIPHHHILRFNELAASRAAAEAGISPAVEHAQPGILVTRFIDGETLTAERVRQELPRALDLVCRVHREMPAHLRGPALVFWVFHVLRDYGHGLAGRRPAAELAALLDKAARLEAAVGPVDLVFGHNDLLAANFIDDGDRLWLVDWDYAGFNSPLFDLGGLASNNGFSVAEEAVMLEAYFGAPASAGLRWRYTAMKAAAALREVLWGMVSEIHSTLEVDYVAYTEANLRRFEAAWTDFQGL